jgi:hypothetical protein
MVGNQQQESWAIANSQRRLRDGHTPQHDDGDEGDLLVGAEAIRAYLISLGWPDPDPYYLKRSGWPIGNTGGDGGKQIASKRRLSNHTSKLTRGPTAA